MCHPFTCGASEVPWGQAHPWASSEIQAQGNFAFKIEQQNFIGMCDAQAVSWNSVFFWVFLAWPLSGHIQEMELGLLSWTWIKYLVLGLDCRWFVFLYKHNASTMKDGSLYISCCLDRLCLEYPFWKIEHHIECFILDKYIGLIGVLFSLV